MELFLQNISTQYNIDPDVICITETWMKDESAPCINLSGYVNTASYYRPNKMKGGGVSLYTRDTLDFLPLSLNIDPVLLSFEYTAKKSPSLETAIIGVYRSNNKLSDKNVFFNCLDLVLQKVVSFKYIIVCSDTNVNLLKDDNDRLRLLSILNLHNLKPSVFTPTRITSSTSTCIDNIFINFPPSLLINNQINNIYSGIGDHKHGQVIQFKIDKHIKSEKAHKRTFTPKQISAFLESLSQTDFSQIYQLSLVNDQLSLFYDIFLFLFNSHFPYKYIVTGRKRRKEWITKGIRVSSENKRALFYMSLHTKDPSFLSYYRTYCRILKKLVNEAKGLHTIQLINQAPKEKKIKTIWNVIKSHSKHNKKKTSDPLKLTVGQKQILNPTAVANTFNQYWINVARDTVNSSSPPSSSSCLSSPCWLPVSSYRIV
uniref:Endonuclease/exonuclease/phosphatase domain-containing protein n=1 Tax=Cacopsylla melanoneura TaxID=428564 RepID=A0A8D8V012_9HEMI